MPVLTETERRAVFDAVKPLLQRYENPLVARLDAPGKYDLWSEKEVVIDGRRRKEVAFAALLEQKGYVGFYFMPTYTHEDTKAVFAPELLQKLKGKSCFHLTDARPETLAQLEDALAKGYARYRAQGWV